jgi:hypothetical protein
MSIDSDDVTAFIQGRLGFPTIPLELDTTHYTLAINQTLRIFAKIAPKVGRDQIMLVAGQQVYPIANAGLGIIKCAIPPSKYRFGLGWGFGDEFSVFDSAVVSDLGHYATAISYYKQARKVLSANFMWKYLIDRQELEISPAPQEPLILSYTYLSSPALSDIQPQYEEWFLEYALLEAKSVLGEIRELMGTVQGNQTNVPLNGAQLKAESSDAVKKDRQQELRNMIGDRYMLPLRDS